MTTGVAIQEARVIRCSELKESESCLFRGHVSENVATKSFQCTTLHREHAKHMHAV